MAKYDAMTVNERLGTAGLFEAWDTAFRDRDRDGMIKLLLAVEIGEAEALQTIDVILKDPSLYGG